MQKVLLCIPTTGRESLTASVRDVLAQVRSFKGHLAIEVHVIWNSQTAPETGLAPENDLQVHWLPFKSVAKARNHALDLAAEKMAQWILFFDDDQVPSSDWLQALLAARQQGDVVFGPVLSVVPSTAPKWSRHSGLHRQALTAVAGPFSGFVYSGNTLFRADLARRAGIRFDESLVFGGEDTDFFYRLRRAGASVYFEKDAVAYEPVHGERLTVRGYLRRAIKQGRGVAMLDARGMFRRFALLRYVYRLIGGTGNIVIGSITANSGTVVFGLARCAFVCGAIWERLQSLREVGLEGPRGQGAQTPGSRAKHVPPKPRLHRWLECVHRKSIEVKHE